MDNQCARGGRELKLLQRVVPHRLLRPDRQLPAVCIHRVHPVVCGNAASHCLRVWCRWCRGGRRRRGGRDALGVPAVRPRARGGAHHGGPARGHSRQRIPRGTPQDPHRARVGPMPGRGPEGQRRPNGAVHRRRHRSSQLLGRVGEGVYRELQRRKLSGESGVDGSVPGDASSALPPRRRRQRRDVRPDRRDCIHNLLSADRRRPRDGFLDLSSEVALRHKRLRESTASHGDILPWIHRDVNST
mmetsp:Transcript_20397/g.53016  ORF Transcript_20397/g.53016 Transcript_20397/m.53016 type:complete len:244 (+) Transcript_20397:2750-3481(+)